MKNGRAPGNGNTSAEIMKASVGACITVWIIFFARIWKSEKVPEEWIKSTLIKLSKKGHASKCNSRRGISLLSIPGKLFSQIVHRRIQTALDKHLRDEQQGFRPSRSCLDFIYVLWTLTAECNEWKKKMYLVFMNFEKAFDSIHLRVAMENPPTLRHSR
ncbi:uncharacterized protein LOC136032470 [Artemia franciscana]|uniref:uncharacterized protein LOC136032470 n=1 Tax=Artemia franciscana TaxID=6661 RepID=UPI0032DA0157